MPDDADNENASSAAPHRKEVNLAGKDWFTVIEAAHYCGVSPSQFRSHALEYGLTPKRFMGKQLYEKLAIYRAIAEAPAWHMAPRSLPLSPELAERLRNGRRRPYKPRKKKATE